ncbi:MAG TPA: hypothetical protein VGV93_12950 [Acidimicrobiales bacterium]|nr:hypothetical protein [Acidimicrobiales bacterium]
MSETSSPTTGDASEEAVRHDARQRSATRQAWIVVVTLAVITTLFIVQFAFSTATDVQTVDGRTATSSQYAD